MKAIEIDQNLFKQKFIDENLSLSEMCKFFNVSLSVIMRMRKKLNLNKNDEQLKESRNKQSIKNIKFSIDPEEVRKFYCEELLSIPLIAQKYKCHKDVIRRIIKIHNIIRTKEQEKASIQKMLERIQDSTYKHFGVQWASQSKEVQKKCEETYQKHYGARRYNLSKDYQNKRVKILEKSFISKKENNTLGSSKGEKELREFIENLGFKTEKIISGYKDTRFEIDIYVPEKNIGLEFNGVYYHSTNFKRINRTYHYQKSLTSENKGFELIHVWQDLWVNKQDIIKNIIKSRLGKLDNLNKIYARKCEVKEINNKEYREFVEKNHIQGFRSAKVKLGLFYNNKLVQIASFDKSRFNKEFEWEWIRGCPASFNIVIGGTSKLFKYFVKKYNPKNVICYADWNLFNGSGYKECGFKFDGLTGPDKFYIENNKGMKRLNRNPYKYKEFKELVNKARLFECYGSGSKRFIWFG